MSGNVRIYNKIDYVYEAYDLLRLMSDDDDREYEMFREVIYTKYGVESPYINEVMASGELVWTEAKAHFADRIHEIRELFGALLAQDEQTTAACLVLCDTSRMPPEPVVYTDCRAIRECYEKMPEAEKDACFLFRLGDLEQRELDAIVGCAARGVTVPAEMRLRGIISYIQGMEIDLAEKAKIQEIYLNRDAWFARATALLDEAAAFLMQYDAKLRELCVVWESYWQKVIEESDFFVRMKNVVKFEPKQEEAGICILPSVVQCVCLWVDGRSCVIPRWADYWNTCRIGLLITDVLDWDSQMKEEYRWDEAVAVFKALGDKSKADILLYIKDRPAYGSEIAKQFSLTTATVSHHMNKLLQLRLVKGELKGGRVYYQARKEYLQELFTDCGKLFG